MNSKRKGKAAELEFAHMLQDHGFSASRGVQFSGSADSPDVKCDELDKFMHWEVKHQENLNLLAAMRQVAKDCPQGKWRCVAHKKNRQGWLVSMPFDDFIDLIKAWWDLTVK